MQSAANRRKRRRGPNRESAHRQSARDREWFAWLKNAPCTDCGISYFPCQMHFDHRLGEVKLFGIAGSRTRSKAKIVVESEKCDLVCANCHALRTQMRNLEGLTKFGRPRK